MTLQDFLTALRSNPESVAFTQTMDAIAANYNYTATAFSNGDTQNAAGTNEGSCKLFAFAKLNGLSVDETLACFGDYYRKDVLENPEGTDHANIRNFMKTGWDGVKFEAEALSTK